MLELSAEERASLAEALRATRVRRHWVRLRAVWLAAEGRSVPEIAADLGAGASSVFGWLAHWRRAPDPAALADGPKSGRPRALDAPLCDELAALLDLPPELYGYQATGWTVAVLEHHFATELAAPVSGTTLRAHCTASGTAGSGPATSSPGAIPSGRGKKLDVARQVRAARAAGAVVLCEDETTLREFPPLRAAWGKRGRAVEVPVTGSNARRVVFGALNPFAGTRLCMAARRNGGPEFRAYLRLLRGTYKRWDLLLVLDRGSCHTAKATLALAAALRITLAWLPTACPELNPVEALWRDAKQRVSANRAHADIDAHAADFVRHVGAHRDRDALRLSGVHSGNFWLTT